MASPELNYLIKIIINNYGSGSKYSLFRIENFTLIDRIRWFHSIDLIARELDAAHIDRAWMDMFHNVFFCSQKIGKH